MPRAKKTWSRIQDRHVCNIDSSGLKSCFSTKILALEMPFEISDVLFLLLSFRYSLAGLEDLPIPPKLWGLIRAQIVEWLSDSPQVLLHGNIRSSKSLCESMLVF